MVAIRCSTGIPDGETCVLDRDGRSNFGALRSAIMRRAGVLVFYAFAPLHLDRAHSSSVRSLSYRRL
jgi:ATP-dependent DNA ligase